jgi:phosphoenolpyruvate synthase/pyruvate phosphate dikinase
MVNLAVLKAKGGSKNKAAIAATEKLLRAVGELHEFNPMLGHRGCRLGITYAEITKMQAKATFEAALRVAKRAAFFSVGTNGRTQMGFGLSRDDAGMFLRWLGTNSRALHRCALRRSASRQRVEFAVAVAVSQADPCAAVIAALPLVRSVLLGIQDLHEASTVSAHPV